MVSEPKISVIICCYNDGKYLPTALDSLKRQTIQDFQTIIVNDGSTDETAEIAKEYLCPDHLNCLYLSDYIEHDKNYGLPTACNNGLALVKAHYFTRLDADDSFQPPALKRMLEVIESTDTDMVFSDRWENDQYIDLSSLPRSYPEYYMRTIQHLVAGGVLFRTELTRKIGGYSQMFWEEVDHLIRYLAQSRKPLGYVPRGLYKYTKRADSMTHGLGTISNAWDNNGLPQSPK